MKRLVPFLFLYSCIDSPSPIETIELAPRARPLAVCHPTLADDFGAACMPIDGQVITSCTSFRSSQAGWCAVTFIGGGSTCLRSCDAAPCPEDSTAIPTVSNHCYCAPCFPIEEPLP